MKHLILVLALIVSFTACKKDPKPKPEPTPIGTPVIPANIKTFHLNYTKDKDWSLCSERDYVVFDMWDTSKAEFKKCAELGATMICYFSSQYEKWREDEGDFGKLGPKLDGWDGENWVDPNDPKNLAVMYKRLDIAIERGCEVIDLDNIDRSGHKEYIREIFKKAKEKGLKVSLKNYILGDDVADHKKNIDYFIEYVDMFQNEQCQQYKECDVYKYYGKPVFNIEYKTKVCKQTDYMFSVTKSMKGMDKNFTICN